MWGSNLIKKQNNNQLNNFKEKVKVAWNFRVYLSKMLNLCQNKLKINLC